LEVSHVVITTDYDVVITPEEGELIGIVPNFLIEQLQQGIPGINVASSVGFATGTFAVDGEAVGVGIITGIGDAEGLGNAFGSGTVSGSVAVAVGAAAGTVGVTGVATGPGLFQGVGQASGTGRAAATGVGVTSPNIATGNAAGLGGAFAVSISSCTGLAAGVGALTAVSATVVNWVNFPLSSVNAQFKCEFDAVPTVAALDDPVGLSNGAASATTSLACIVRFNNAGQIDVRSGATYLADVSLNYTAGSSYHVRIMGDIGSHTYDVYITPPASTETKIASAYAFRTEQASATILNNLAVAPATVGGTVSCTNITLVSVVSPPVVTSATFNITMPLTAGQTVGTMTATGSPTSWAIVTTGAGSPVVTPASFTVATNPAASVAVGTVVASNSPNYFTIVSGDPGKNFTIDASGNIKTSSVTNGEQLTNVGRAGAAALGLPNYSATLTVNSANVTISSDTVYRNVNFSGQITIIGGNVLFEYCLFSNQPGSAAVGRSAAVLQYNGGGFCGNTQFNFCDWDSGWTTSQGNWESDGFGCGTRQPVASGGVPTTGTSSSFNLYRCNFQHYGNLLALHKWQHNNVTSYVTECMFSNNAQGGTNGSLTTHPDMIEYYSSDTITIQRNKFVAATGVYTSIQTDVFSDLATASSPSFPNMVLNNFFDPHGQAFPYRVGHDTGGFQQGCYAIGNHWNDQTAYNAITSFDAQNVTFDLAYAQANPTTIYWAKSNVWAAGVTSPPGGYSGGQIHTPGQFADQVNFCGETTSWGGSIVGPTTGNPTPTAFPSGTYNLTVTATNGFGTGAPVTITVTIS
jgi:hypothetical protein